MVLNSCQRTEDFDSSMNGPAGSVRLNGTAVLAPIQLVMMLTSLGNPKCWRRTKSTKECQSLLAACPLGEFKSLAVASVSPAVFVSTPPKQTQERCRAKKSPTNSMPRVARSIGHAGPAISAWPGPAERRWL